MADCFATPMTQQTPTFPHLCVFLVVLSGANILGKENVAPCCHRLLGSDTIHRQVATASSLSSPPSSALAPCLLAQCQAQHQWACRSADTYIHCQL